MKRADVRVVSARREPKPRIELAIGGASVTIGAAQLIVAYDMAAGDVLLVLDDDCPFEEQLHLVLVRGGVMVDQIVIGAPMAPGIFREIDASDDRLRFAFDGGEPFELTVRAGRRASLPRGVRRRIGRFAPRYLEVTRVPAISAAA